MRANDKPHIAALMEACHRAAALDLIRYSSGNMSCRLPGDRMAVTAKGSWLGSLTARQIAVCRLADSTPLNGIRPSVESHFHAGVLRARPDIHVVLHCQSPMATAIACGKPETHNYMLIPEIPFYIGPPAIVPYGNPGSLELAAKVIRAMRKHDLAILRNHGQVVVGRTFDDAFQRAGFFELACTLLLAGGRTGPIPRAGVAALYARRAREASA